MFKWISATSTKLTKQNGLSVSKKAWNYLIQDAPDADIIQFVAEFLANQQGVLKGEGKSKGKTGKYDICFDEVKRKFGPGFVNTPSVRKIEDLAKLLRLAGPAAVAHVQDVDAARGGNTQPKRDTRAYKLASQITTLLEAECKRRQRKQTEKVINEHKQAEKEAREYKADTAMYARDKVLMQSRHRGPGLGPVDGLTDDEDEDDEYANCENALDDLDRGWNNNNNNENEGGGFNADANAIANGNANVNGNADANARSSNNKRLLILYNQQQQQQQQRFGNRPQQQKSSKRPKHSKGGSTRGSKASRSSNSNNNSFSESLFQQRQRRQHAQQHAQQQLLEGRLMREEANLIKSKAKAQEKQAEVLQIIIRLLRKGTKSVVKDAMNATLTKLYAQLAA